MSSTFDDTVLNFDLNLLRQPFSKPAVQTNEDRTRRGIIRVKRKIIATDCLIRKYYDKRDLLHQVEKSLLVTKEECKQACLDYKNAADKCVELEKNVQMLQITNEELNKKCVDSENSCGALQSYANQLQLHVKETETRVEALEIESKLEKTNTKDISKKVTTLQGTHDVLLNHLFIAKEILYGKKKFSKKFKELLRKYDKPVQDTLEENNADDFDVASCNSPASTICPEEFLENDNDKDLHSLKVDSSEDIDRVRINDKNEAKNKDVDHDYDSSHEVVSEDTGRGSSLAFSDSDKCYQSPDYFSNDSPSNGHVDISKKSKYIDKSTSPIRFHESDIITDICRDPIHKKTIDAATSPLSKESNNYSKKLMKRAISPIELHTTENTTVTDNHDNQEIECLELNNSQNLYPNSAEDSEVQMILNEMRLNNNLITPMPTSPSKSRGPESGGQDIVRELMSDVGKIREDNKILYSMFATVTKSIVNIQQTMKNCLGHCKCECSRKEIHTSVIPVYNTVIDQNVSSPMDNEFSTTSNTIITPVNTVHVNQQNTSSPIENVLFTNNTSVTPINKTNVNERNISSPIENVLFTNNTSVTPINKSNANKLNICSLIDNDLSTTNNTIVRIQFEDPLPCLTQNEDIVSESRLHSPIVSSIHAENDLTNSDQISVKNQKKREPLKTKRAKMEILRQRVIERRKIKRFIFLDQKLSLRTKRRILVKKTTKKINSLDSLSDKVNHEGVHKILESNLRPSADSNDISNKSINSEKLALNSILKTNETEIHCIKNANIESSNRHIDNKVKAHKKVPKAKKISKLEKLKKQNLPRGKIRKHVTPTKKKSYIKRKQLMIHKKEVKLSDSSVSLNDKDVYEKACRVMAELKSKQKHNCLEKRSFKKPSTMAIEKHKHISKDTHLKLSDNSKTIIDEATENEISSPTHSLCNVDNNITENRMLLVKNMQHIKTYSTKEKDLHISPVIYRNTRKFTQVSGCDEIIEDSESTSKETSETVELKLENNKRLALLNGNDKIMHDSLNSLERSSGSIQLSPEKSSSVTRTNRVSESQTSLKDTVSIKVDNQQFSNKNSPNKCFNEENRYVVVVVQDVLKDSSEILGKPEIQFRDSRMSDKIDDVKVDKDANGYSLRQRSRKRRERDSVDKLESPHKRLLRSSITRQLSLDFDQDYKKSKGSETALLEVQSGINEKQPNRIFKYDDMDMFNNNEESVLECTRDVVDKLNSLNKRVLRSSTIQQSQLDTKKNLIVNNAVEKVLTLSEREKSKASEIISYCDLDMFSSVEKSSPDQNDCKTKKTSSVVFDVQNLSSPAKMATRTSIIPNLNITLNTRAEMVTENQYKNNLLCLMIEKYGRHSIKTTAKKADSVVNTIYKKIENRIAEITEINPTDTKEAMNKFVEEIQSWNLNHFVSGLMKYLESPERKTELFSKVYGPPAPALTKSEQILLYVIPQLNICRPEYNIVNVILNNIEYILFRLHQTPVFEIIDSMSHFYAVLCRYFRKKSRLRMFLLDAMYCIQYKSIPLIRQCLDVWMHILPLSHMGLAKTPLVVCLVYLLHFYKCEDKFRRAQDLRHILNRRYSYQMSDWNESRIMEILKNALHDVRETPVEKKMLRMSIIIFAKRQGPRWCQTNIITNMLQPMIEGHNVSVRVKIFCISLLGPLLKPYPADMKVHCEVVMDKLLDMLTKNPSEQMKEAIFTSLIYMHRHNIHKVYEAMLSYNPQKISSDFEELLRDHVREKPVKAWTSILSKK